MAQPEFRLSGLVWGEGLYTQHTCVEKQCQSDEKSGGVGARGWRSVIAGSIHLLHMGGALTVPGTSGVQLCGTGQAHWLEATGSGWISKAT